MKLSAENVAYVIAHGLLHLAFRHFRSHAFTVQVWGASCDIVNRQFLKDLSFGKPVFNHDYLLEGLSNEDEEKLAKFLDNMGYDPKYACMGLGPSGKSGLKFGAQSRSWGWGRSRDWQALLSQGLQSAVSSAVAVAAGEIEDLSSSRILKSAAEKAKRWFVDRYPLLGSLASSIKIIENRDLCVKFDIAVAAVNIELKEIYINPICGLDGDEMQFVIAHELLHVGLRHDRRRQGRDPFFWNVACDYIINSWLKEMGVGRMPVSALFDPALSTDSAESVYDQIVIDIRKLKKLSTLAGQGKCDMIEPSGSFWSTQTGVDLDSFYRNCLMQGLEYHQSQQRGLLPGNLIEEINSLSQPAIEWDVELAKWFDGHFRPIEKRRTYSRPSRRQSMNLDIPLPRYAIDHEASFERTYGVILDTSGSMDRNLLAKALGAIVSYSMARDVSQVRLVFCDADAYDQGFVSVESLAETVHVKGRGGTVLQPGIDCLERDEQLPKTAPLLIITDGGCDPLKIRREHAFLIPSYGSLPFQARGPVFRIN